jgi:BlaI family penicillinase repressor
VSGIPTEHLSRRERQIMDIVYARGRLSAADVQEMLHDAPGYSAVRSALRLLEKKGLLTHRCDGGRYIFEPTGSVAQAGQSALRRVLATFFRNSAHEAVQTILSDGDLQLNDREIAKIEKMIGDAKKRRRK